MSPEEWAHKIKDLINEAELEGMIFWFRNECCGCSAADLMVHADPGAVSLEEHEAAYDSAVVIY